MHTPLFDITDRIPESPKWWLEGIPRYCDYEPREGNFGSTQILLKIKCQVCLAEFNVAIRTDEKLGPNLINAETGRQISCAYDDPPFHLRDDGYNCGGNAMVMELLEVLQVWHNSDGTGWTFIRQPELEGILPQL